jgi:hypothetical protein
MWDQADLAKSHVVRSINAVRVVVESAELDVSKVLQAARLLDKLDRNLVFYVLNTISWSCTTVVMWKKIEVVSDAACAAIPDFIYMVFSEFAYSRLDTPLVTFYGINFKFIMMHFTTCIDTPN